MVDDRIGSALHRTTPNRIALGPELGVAHPVLMRQETAEGLSHFGWVTLAIQVQVLKCLHDRCDVSLPQLVEVGLGLLASLSGLCAKDFMGDCP